MLKIYLYIILSVPGFAAFTQTNCPAGFYADYILNPIKQPKANEYVIEGNFIAEGDSIATVEFYTTTETSAALLQLEATSAKVENVFVKKTAQGFVINVKSGFNFKNKNISCRLNRADKNLKEVSLYCKVTFKNGCLFIKKQKISLNSYH